MKTIIASFVILSIFTSIGCLNDSNTKIQNAEPSSATVAPLISDTNANKNQITTVPTFPSTITSKPVSSATLNPAHGQPGHRCEIAVGAPLDNKPAQTTIQPKPATTTAPPLSIPSATGTGLNPAHGKPGHRCEIAVGAPLDSKPAQTTIQSKPAATTATPLSIIPSATGAGLNPAHGQPGHRCDIAVGAPLNSKPAK